MTPAVIRLASFRNNLSVHCAQPSVVHPEPDGLGIELASTRTETDAVVFVEREPEVIHEDVLINAVTRARELGFRRIGIQTAGCQISGTGRLAKLVQAGLSDIHFVLYGANPAIHDYHTGITGGFEQAFTALRIAGSLSLTVGVTTVLTRSNYRMLEPIRRLLQTTGADAWNLLIPRAENQLPAAFDRTMPRLAMALPFALHALSTANSRGLPTFIQGAPSCLLGPMGTRTLKDEPRAYAPVCSQCPSRAHCPGVDKEYLARFEGDELRARDTPPPDENQSPLRMLFVSGRNLTPTQTSPTQTVPLTQQGRKEAE